ncbi:MAG: glycoside hydrolase family 3 C-terminal domain-containing protein, partial [Oscillospiraceae bacterium]|nr:glycoside hydrolase family 3 C-terminal domain-containing protein [Oscillospiraceae bacterium]
LKHENALPLKQQGQKIALIGPYADSQDIIGMWAIHADKRHAVTIRAAMAEVLGEEGFVTAKGCELLDDYSVLGEFGNIPAFNSSLTEKTDPAALEREALEAAAGADVIVMALGEHMLQSGEAGARTDITLPAPQKRLLRKIRTANPDKKLVLILFNGRPLALADVLEDCDAILEAWFPGTAGGRSVCDVLFGDCNPSGRLTMSFPYNVGQVPLYYAQLNTGRPAKTSSHSGRFVSKYLDCPNEALFPFGYGLSYHTASYSGVTLDRDSLRAGEALHAAVTVENTGDTAGTETVQLYIRDLVGSVARPVLELKDWQRVPLQPGERREVTFTVTEEMLRFYTKDMTFASEPGGFEVYVGPNSRDLQKAAFTLI